MVKFSVLVQQTCVLYTKKLFHTLSVLEKRPKNVLKTSQSDSRSMTSLGRPQGVNLIIIHKIGFQGNFSVFLDAKCRSDIAEPDKVKNLLRPILVLLRSGTSRPK